jgi:hypothetical protein
MVVSDLFGFPAKYVEEHWSEEKLFQLRYQCDQLADHALVVIESTSIETKKPFATVLESYLNNSIRCNSENVQNFLHQVYTVPVWVDWIELRRGQRVFLAHAASSSLSLLYLSLIGGFSAPKIVKVLECTSYLTSNEYFIYKRLLETMEMIVDCLEQDALLPGHEGWMSVLKVRFLHAKVRRKILQSNFDIQTYGQPINEEDLIATQLAFSQVLLIGIDKFGNTT